MNGLMPQRPGAKTGTHPSALKHDLVAKIIALCDQEGYGIRSITHLLQKQGGRLSHMSVYRYLINRGRMISRPRKKRRLARLHVCDYPGEEAQLDVMFIDPLPGTEKLGSRQGFFYQLRDLSGSYEEKQNRLAAYLRHYNNQRPHWGLGMDGKTPLEKLQSFTEYQSVNLIV
jgi:hypothetical protein